MKKTKLVREGMRRINKIGDGISLGVIFSIAITSIFSLMGVTAYGKSSTDMLSGAQSTVPQIMMIYDNKAYDMSTFVLAHSGQMKKITIPSDHPPEDGSNPPVRLELGNTVHFQFDKQPTKVNAYIIDMEAQPVELYAQRQIGPSDFQIVGPEGILNYEVHAFFADGQYTSQYILANVSAGVSPAVSNFGVDRASTDNGYIALSDKQACNNADRLRTLEVSSNAQDNNNKSKSNSPVTVLDNNLQTAWAVKGTDVKSFVTVKSSLDEDAQTARSSDKSPWLQLDLGADKTVCNIGLAFPNGDKSINFFKVQASIDGEHFTDVGLAESYPLGAGGQLFSFPDMPDKSRYVRISDVGNLVSGDTEIAEFMAAGK
ncbi:MAG: discoidin domain-containing protein [Nitrososphaeraceae archaeon]